jgi:putative ABC transport system substrate-binding protein
MRRRDLLLGASAAAIAPAVARAQPSALPVIGLLSNGSPDGYAERLRQYFKGLADSGFVEGDNVRVEYRWAMGDNSKLSTLAGELVGQKVTVIATPASTPAAVAAKAATAMIPIIFAVGADPVRLGLVQSISHPGGNATGATSLNTELAAKRLSLLRELVPRARHFVALINPSSPLSEPFAADLRVGADRAGIPIDFVEASNDAEIEQAIARAASQPDSVLLCGSDGFFYIRREQIAALALRHALPTMFDVHEYVDAGALVSYGSDFSDVLQLAGHYTGRILKGEKPAELPVAQSSKFELTVNLKTAKALGLTVPQMLLAQADEVIE